MTIEKAAPEQAERIAAVLAKGEELTADELFAVLPEGKLFGAHLPHSTAIHWIYAAVAIVGFLLLVLLMFSVERSNPLHLLGIGLFTGTVGIIFLFAVQFCSQIDIRSIRVRGWIGLIFLILALIGLSYRSALDPDSNLMLERNRLHLRRGAVRGTDQGDPPALLLQAFRHHGLARRCVWGLASGIGFGVSEGIMYSADSYNGISGAGSLRGPIHILRGDPRDVGGSGRDHDRPDSRCIRSRRRPARLRPLRPARARCADGLARTLRYASEKGYERLGAGDRARVLRLACVSDREARGAMPEGGLKRSGGDWRQHDRGQGWITTCNINIPSGVLFTLELSWMLAGQRATEAWIVRSPRAIRPGEGARS